MHNIIMCALFCCVCSLEMTVILSLLTLNTYIRTYVIRYLLFDTAFHAICIYVHTYMLMRVEVHVLHARNPACILRTYICICVFVSVHSSILVWGQIMGGSKVKVC